jgi:tetratricopeptide (TPR) repeat protein
VKTKPPLVGRQEEIETILGSLAEALAGSGSLVLISGEAGTGKSRLLEYLMKASKKIGFFPTIGRAIPGASTPFLLFQELFSTFPGGPISRHTHNNVTPSDTTSVFLDVLEFLSNESEKRPLLICLDDLHWADSVSIQLLHFLARNVRTLHVMLVGTYRTEEISITESGLHLLASLRIMRREDICLEVQLKALADEDMGAMISGMLDGSVHEEIVRRIVEESGGNPLFAVETVRLLASSGVITQRDSCWVFVSEGKIDIPSNVKEVILRRIESMPDHEKRILECASVIGEYFDPEIVIQILNLNRLRLYEDLESMEKKLHLVYEVENEYRFNHEKIRRVTYDEISSPRRRELHRLVAEFFETRMPDERFYAQLSYHLCLSKQSDKCINYSIKAGEYCLLNSGGAEAVPYFQRAIEFFKQIQDDGKGLVRAYDGLSKAYCITGSWEKSAECLEKAISLSKESEEIARLQLDLAYIWTPYFLGSKDSSKSSKLIETVEKSQNLKPIDFGRIKIIQSEIAFSHHRLDEAERTCAEAENILKDVSQEYMPMVYLLQLKVLVAKGEMEQAIKSGLKALDLYSKGQRDANYTEVLVEMGVAYDSRGSTERALDCFEKAIDFARKFGDNTNLFEAYHCLAQHYGVISDYKTASRYAKMSYETAKIVDIPFVKGIATALYAQYEALLGNIANAEQLATEAQEQHSIISDSSPRRLVYVTLRLAQAEIAATKEEWATSNKYFQDVSNSLTEGICFPLEIALSRMLYGESLLKQGLRKEAECQLSGALDIYERLGNHILINRSKSLLRGG